MGLEYWKSRELLPALQVQILMRTTIMLATVLLYGLAACTTAGAPEPGERAAEMLCQSSELKVCTGIKGTRIKTERGTCSCT